MLKYYSIYLASASLFLLLACRATPAEVEIDIKLKFIDGAAAAALITTDPDEGYFDHWSPADARLQMGLADTVAVNLEEYKVWLAALPQVWPPVLKEKMEHVWMDVLTEFIRLYPQLELEDVQLILTEDQPYGSFVYFTRQNAVICPITDLEMAPEAELRHVMRHELFHLLSRAYSGHRKEAYAFIGFKPVPQDLIWPGDLYERRLHNPDAPFPDYGLLFAGQQYVPLVYASQSPYDPANPDHFAEQLRFSYFRLEGDSLKRPILSADEVVQATGGLTDYVLHPEEILADQFAQLLEQGGPEGDPKLILLDEILSRD